MKVCDANIALGQSCTTGPNTNDGNCQGLACGSDGLCGGEGIYTGQECGGTTGTCETSGCYSGLQVSLYCRAKHQTRLGETCVISPQCPIGVACTNGYCGSQGACSPDDTTLANGPSSTCSNGQTCINNFCETPYSMGQTCTNDYQCANSGCSYTCGGNGATCTTDDPTLDYGPSVQCSSNYCSYGSCADDPTAGVCKSDADCPSPFSCGTGGCGKEGAWCAPDSPSGDNSGVSSLCSSAYACYSSACQLSGYVGKGGSCDGTNRCSPELHCTNGVCSDQVPPNTGDSCGSDDGCAGSICVDNVCTLDTPAPGSSDKPNRRDIQTSWTNIKCPRGGQIACPIGNRGALDTAYEVRCPIVTRARLADDSVLTR